MIVGGLGWVLMVLLVWIIGVVWGFFVFFIGLGLVV